MVLIIVGSSIGFVFWFCFCLACCVCCEVRKRRNDQNNPTQNNRTLNTSVFLIATVRATPANTNNSQINSNRNESGTSYDAALRNSNLVNQPNNQADLNECKLPTYEESTSKKNWAFLKLTITILFNFFLINIYAF